MGKIKFFEEVILFFLLSNSVFAQNVNNHPPINVGAYYFDGWKSKEINNHLTAKLKNDFSNREPIWGWETSTQSIMDKQIIAADNAGITFFSFCWYYKSSQPVDSTNRALVYFNHSQEKYRLKYCLMVANHKGFEIGPNEWNKVTEEWLKQFKQMNYLKVDGKPLLIFFSVQALINKFGSAANVKQAFDQLKSTAKQQGFSGISIAACVGSGKTQIAIAKSCGFDILTGYNYHEAGLKKETGKINIPIGRMQVAEKGIWEDIAQKSALPYIPVVTLNWDPRPWATKENKYATAPYFVGFTPTTAATSIKNAIDWVKNHPQNTTTTKVILIYAWNEYGEGAYLTPAINGTNYLQSIKRTVNESTQKN